LLELRLSCKTGTPEALKATTIGGWRHEGSDRVGRRDDLRNGEVEIDVELEVDFLDRSCPRSRTERGDGGVKGVILKGFTV
jgi:hypothetical protein